jgi:hypothetical protein
MSTMSQLYSRKLTCERTSVDFALGQKAVIRKVELLPTR